MKDILERVSKIGIVPVVKITDAQDALPLAQALLDGGIDVAEITFRSKYATQAIADIHQAYPMMLLGAGTVQSIEQAKEAIDAGAAFIVTPGFNVSVVTWCIEHEITVLPGVSTASEIELALSYGLSELKFFPAETSGGAKKLKDFSAVYPQVTFLTTGGINEHNMHDYLTLPNVMAIGGSFMLKDDLIQAKEWTQLTQLSHYAIQQLLGYELIHLGINHSSCEEAEKNAMLLCHLFGFTYYKKPKSHFAGKGFELLNQPGRGEHGHFGIYTPYPERAMYHLQKLGITFVEESITRNKKTNRVNFVYLNLELAGFGIHLIHPDVKM